MIAYRVALVFRAAYLALIGSVFFLGEVNSSIMHLPIFLVTLLSFKVAKKDERWYVFDALVVLLFLTSLSLQFFPSVVATYGYVFGIDKILHMLGGMIVGYAGYLLFGTTDRMKNFLLIVLTALAVGAGWEVFEWMLHLLPAPWTVASSGYADSMLDLIADALGALAVAVWIHARIKRQRMQ